jgi:hypothetical protein
VVCFRSTQTYISETIKSLGCIDQGTLMGREETSLQEHSEFSTENIDNRMQNAHFKKTASYYSASGVVSFSPFSTASSTFVSE